MNHESQSTADELRSASAKRKQAWSQRASKYDRSMGFFERHLLGEEHRRWACSKAGGRTLEVAVGTGLNIPLYPDDVDLVGIDLSPEMLEIARRRSQEVGRAVDLHEGDAHSLPFAEASFDTVVCTYSLCNIPDPHLAVGEMKRVLRPNGTLILVDHIRSSVKPVLWLQKGLEFFSKRSEGEHLTRRPLAQVEAHSFEIVERKRSAPGAIVERVVAIKR
jgi:ubiquinone/menaquinone biosynthesis C-methylase UbiE